MNHIAMIAMAILGLSAAGSSPARTASIETIRSPAIRRSGEPRLTTGPEGRPAMSWFEVLPSGRHRLMWALTHGNRWSKPVTIAEGDSFFVNWADFPSSVWLGGERWAAHWLWRTGGETYAYEVRLSFSEDGGKTWGNPVVPHRDGTRTEHGFVSLVPEAGRVRAVWLDGRNFAGHEGGHPEGADMTLRTALVDGDGSLLQEGVIDARVCDCCATAAVGTAGGVLVAYRDRSDREIRDISLARLESGAWTPPATLHDDHWRIEGCPVNGPSLDALGDRVAAAWFTAAAETSRVRMAWSMDGGRTFGAPVAIDEGAPLGRVDVVVMPDSSAVVTWIESEGKAARVLARRVTRTGAAESPIVVARTSAARASGFPQVTRMGRDLLFAWTEAGRVSRIHAARMRLEK